MNGSGVRSLTSLYVAAPFSMGYVDFYTFLMPLYALSLGFDAAEVGILVGARSIVAMFLSIHIGVLMDRSGTRKITLSFVWIGMILAPLFPLVPWFWSLLALQLHPWPVNLLNLSRARETGKSHKTRSNTDMGAATSIMPGAGTALRPVYFHLL